MKYHQLLRSNRPTCRPLVSDDSKLIFLAAVLPLSIHVYSTQSSLSVSSLRLPDPNQNDRLIDILRHPSSSHQFIILVSSNGSIFIFDYIQNAIKYTYDTNLPHLISSSIRNLSSQSPSSDPSTRPLTLFLIAPKAAKYTPPQTKADKPDPSTSQPAKRSKPSPRTTSVIYAITLDPSPSPPPDKPLNRTDDDHETDRLARAVRKIKLLKVDGLVTTSATSPCGNWLGIVTRSGVWIIRLRHNDLFARITTSDQQRTPTFQVIRLAAPESITTIAFPPKVHADHFSSSGQPTSIDVACIPRDFFATGSTTGKIALWHALSEAQWDGMVKSYINNPGVPQACPTSVSHWHAHPVADLEFTRNGAHLLSGGEEAVLVLWKLDEFGTVGMDSKAFLPRLRTRIQAISLVQNVDTNQPGASIVGHDGVILIVNTATMSVSKTLRLPMMLKLPDLYTQSPPSIEQPVLLTIASSESSHPTHRPYGNLLIRSSHPCGLQILDGGTGQLLEDIIVRPMNLISRRGGGRPIAEPKLLFVALGGVHHKYLATIDCWADEGRGFSPETTLKLWERAGHGNPNGFHPIARVDHPHDDCRITSLKLTTDLIPKLITTSMDGTIKIWTSSSSTPLTTPNSTSTRNTTNSTTHHHHSKRLRFANLKSIKLNHKGYGILKTLISRDNSILIALHQDDFNLNIISVWDIKNFKLLRTFNLSHYHPSPDSLDHPSPKYPKSIILDLALVGPKDQFIFVLGNSGCSLVDLLTGSERAFWSCRPRFLVKTSNEAQVAIVHEPKYSAKPKSKTAHKARHDEKPTGSSKDLVMSMIDIIQKKTVWNKSIGESSRAGIFIDSIQRRQLGSSTGPSKDKTMDGLVLVSQSAGLIRYGKAVQPTPMGTTSAQTAAVKIEQELGISSDLPFREIFTKTDRQDTLYLESLSLNEPGRLDRLVVGLDGEDDEFKLEIERFVHFSPHVIPSSRLIWSKLIRPIKVKRPVTTTGPHPSTSKDSNPRQAGDEDDDDHHPSSSSNQPGGQDQSKDRHLSLFDFNRTLGAYLFSHLHLPLEPLKVDELID